MVKKDRPISDETQLSLLSTSLAEWSRLHEISKMGTEWLGSDHGRTFWVSVAHTVNVLSVQTRHISLVYPDMNSVTGTEKGRCTASAVKNGDSYGEVRRWWVREGIWGVHTNVCKDRDKSGNMFLEWGEKDKALGNEAEPREELTLHCSLLCDRIYPSFQRQNTEVIYRHYL